MDLNNRELAAAIWLTAGLVFGLTKRDVRSSIKSVLQVLLGQKILVPLVIMVGYVLLLAWGGRRVGVWNVDLTKETIIWFFGSAAVLFFSVTNASEEGFFKRAALRTLEVTVLVEFFMNLFVLNLPAELILQPVILLFTLLPVFSVRDPKYQQVKRFSEVVLVTIGFTIGASVLFQLATRWEEIEFGSRFLELAVPVWMTLGLLPFIYALSLYVAYESSFVRINIVTEDRTRRRRAKIALLTTLHGRIRALGLFNHPWAKRLTSEESFRSARGIVKELRQTAASRA